MALMILRNSSGRLESRRVRKDNAGKSVILALLATDLGGGRHGDRGQGKQKPHSAIPAVPGAAEGFQRVLKRLCGTLNPFHSAWECEQRARDKRVSL